jgi:hypothetical protein
MRAEIKYLSIGLFIGLGGTALLFAGMLAPPKVADTSPSITPAISPTALTFTPLPSPTKRPPTHTFTPTPTFIHLVTETSTNTPTNTPTQPSPTPTHTPVPTQPGAIKVLLESGHLSQSGPLSLKQQFQVYGASVKYIRENSESSRILGEQINGPGYGAPSDICGPLSIAILQDAGIINQYLDPHDFWLLNPDVDDDRQLLARAFPPEQFENTRVRVKLDKVDWNETPLYPGDFVYIYAGSFGNFEHMLVVNRVDSEGRAYAVTNRNTPDGYIISEVLLYHPEKSDVGMFPVWTAHPFAKMGATGFGGFEIWRMRTRTP